MARGRARRNRQRSAPAYLPSAANDAQPLDLVDRIIAVFPPDVAAAARARRTATSETGRVSARLRKRAAANDRGRVDPTPEQLARGTIAPAKTKDPDHASSITVPRNAAAPIDRWRARKLLTERQFDAADRYRSDYARGGYERSVISRYDGGGGSGDGTPNMTGVLAATAAQIDARRQLAAARNELPRRLQGYFDAIVLHEAAADAIGGSLGRSGNTRATAALLVVETCADILGDFYRLPE